MARGKEYRFALSTLHEKFSSTSEKNKNVFFFYLYRPDDKSFL